MTINEWLEISEMSGKGNAKVTLTAPSYEEGETRTLQLAVRGRYGTKYVNIRQNSKEEILVNQYLWVLLEEEGKISGIKSNTIQYSYDRESWTSFPANGSITVPANTYVWFKNTRDILNYGTTINDDCTSFTFSKRGSIGGDLSSLGDMREKNFMGLFYRNTNLTDASQLILPWDELEYHCFIYMFNGCTSLVNAPSIIPAKKVGRWSCSNMFDYCTSLETAPELPATTLAESCYLCMFCGCTSLTTAPHLPATTLADSCYDSMFRGCSSLTTAPTLPAPTLVNSCYWGMFYGCSNLNYIKMLATDINAIACLNNWVEGVAPTGTFVKHPNMNDLTIGVDGIPEGWVVMNEGNGEGDDDEDVNNDYFWVKLEEDGEISGIKTSTIQYSYDKENWSSFPSNSSITAPANTYVWLRNTDEKLNYDYYLNKISFSTRGSVGGDLSSMGSMQKENFHSLFSYNENLTDASKLILPWDVLEEGCYDNMFGNCTSLINAPELLATTLARRCCEFMFYNCTSLTTAPVLPATTLDAHCYYSMFKGCTSLTTAPELPATTLAETCYLNMFIGCTSLTTAPVLPAPTLEDDCYGYMFVGCTNLNYIKILATDLYFNNTFTYGWVRGVAPTGTFVKKQGVGFMDGDSGIPDGWTVIEITE